MRITFGRLISLGGLALAGMLVSAAAAAPPSPPIGVWQGTLGGQPVTACFNDDQIGAYYYRRHLQAIMLQAADTDSAHWSEMAGDSGTVSGIWALSKIGADHIEGQWSDSAGQRHLPLLLTRMGLKDKDAPPCGTADFNAPIELPPKIVQGSPKVFDGKHYRTVTATAAQFSVETLELLEPGAGIAALNAQLRRLLPTTPQALADLYSCSRQSLGTQGGDGENNTSVTPELWTERYLVTQTNHETSCGGAYPNTEIISATWNLQSGQAEDMTKWLKAGRIDDKLAAIIRRQSPRNTDSDCADALAMASAFDIRPGRKGLIFIPDLPHAVQACADDILVPYEALTNFLSPTGVAGARAMEKG